MNGKLFDASIPRFLLVGVGNTLLSAALMFLLEPLGFWLSTAVAYIAGAVLSFFLNRRFTFRSEAELGKSALRFALNVAVCYLLAYAVARHPGGMLLGAMGIKGIWLERLTKLGGVGLYTVLNYLGQRFFTFQKCSI